MPLIQDGREGDVPADVEVEPHVRPRRPLRLQAIPPKPTTGHADPTAGSQSKPISSLKHNLDGFATGDVGECGRAVHRLQTPGPRLFPGRAASGSPQGILLRLRLSRLPRHRRRQNKGESL